MKWGVRRAQKKAARADRKWQKNIYSLKGAVAVHNATADKVNASLGALNSKYPTADVTKSIQSKATRSYIREYESLVERSSKEAVQQVHGTSPSGTLRARLDTSNPEQWSVKVDTVEARHADDALPVLVFNVDQDDGHVGNMHYVKDDVEQSSMAVQEFIEHHGVKGMRWGVRRARSGRSKGERQGKRTVYSKSPKKLTNAELDRRIKRMEMEKRYNDLNKRDVSNGEKIARDVLTNVGKQTASNVGTKLLTNAALLGVESGLKKTTNQQLARYLITGKK